MAGHTVKVKPGYSLDNRAIRWIWNAFTVGFFISPVFLLSDKDIFTREISVVRLLEVWRHIGNAERPAALVAVERMVLHIVFCIIRGYTAEACLASFSSYWMSFLPGQHNHSSVAGWFVTEPSAASVIHPTARPAQVHPGLINHGAVPSRSKKDLAQDGEPPSKKLKMNHVSVPSPSTGFTAPSAANSTFPSSTPSATTQQGQLTAADKINTMKTKIRSQENEIAAQRKQIDKQNEEISKLRQAKDKAVNNLVYMIGNLRDRVLAGQPEAVGVTTLPGAIDAIKKAMARISSETDARVASRTADLQEALQVVANELARVRAENDGAQQELQRIYAELES